MTATHIGPAAGKRPRARPRDAVIAGGLSLLALLAYLRTMRPTFGWGDSSELITAAYHLGVGHSPGYPTWMLIFHPFSRLPIGDVAFRVNFANALFGAVAVGLLYLVYRAITGNRIAAAVGALSFAFAATFWDITTETDVFTLHVCLAATILLIALRWRRARGDAWLYLLSWVIGVSLGNHALIVLMAPPLIYLVWSTRGWRFFTAKRVLICTGFLALGLAVYVYLPIRGAADPPPQVNNPHSLTEVWAQLTAPGARESMFDRGLGVVLGRSWYYLTRLIEEFGWAGVIIGLFGLGALWRRDRPLAVFLAAVALLAVAYASNFSIFDIYTYYLPLHIVWGGFLAMGAASALALGEKAIERAQRGRGALTRGWRVALIAALLLALPFSLFSAHLPEVDGRDEYGSERFARAVFGQVEQGAMILADWWTIAPLGYLKYVEGERMDVTLFPGPSIYTDDGFIDFSEEEFLRRYPAVYFVEMLTYRAELLRERSYLVPEGPVSRVFVDRPEPGTLLANDEGAAPFARFGDTLSLLPPEIEPGALRPGNCLEFVLYWTPLPDYQGERLEVIAVLENEEGGRIWQESNIVGHDLYPLTRWQAGEVLTERHSIYLPEPVTIGEYELKVRVRDRTGGQATYLACDRHVAGGRERDCLISRLEVGEAEASHSGPRFPAAVAWLRR